MDSENKIPFFAPYPGATLKDVLKEEKEMTRELLVDSDTKIELRPGYGHGDGINYKNYGKVVHIMVEQHNNFIITSIVKQSTLEMLRDFINEYLEKYNGKFLMD